MATISRRGIQAAETNPRRPAGRSRIRLAIGAAMVLLAGLWLVPWMVAKTPLAHVALRFAAGKARWEGRIAAQSMSLGWLSPVEVCGIELEDQQGKPLARVARLSLDRTLLGLLFNRARLGRITLTEPRIEIELREKGSNLEEVLSAWFDDPSPAAESPTALELVVVDGQISVKDLAARRAWRLEQLAVHLVFPDSQAESIEMDLAGQVKGDARQGKFSLQMKLPAAGTKQSTEASELVLRAESLPLAASQALLRRVAPACRLEGLLSANLTASWLDAGPGQERRVAGEVVVEDLLLAGPWADGETLRLKNVRAPCRLAMRGDRVMVDQLAVDCELGRIACQGTVDDAGSLLAQDKSAEVLDVLTDVQGSLDASLDVARLAELLPATLKIRQGTRVTSGQVHARLASNPAEAGWSFSGRLEATPLLATAQGRSISWEQPLLITLQAHGEQQKLVVDRLYCESDFLRIEGSGTADAFALSASHELDRLTEQLGRFVDTRGLRLSGTGSSSWTWKRGPDGAFEAGGKMRVAGLQLGGAGEENGLVEEPGIDQEQLELSVEAGGRIEGFSPKRLDRAELVVQAGPDRLAARLRQPTEHSEASWPVSLELKGKLGRWLSRARPLGLVADFELDGQAELVVDADCSSQAIHARHVDLAIQDLHLAAGGLVIDEPLARLQGEARWALDPARLDLDELTVDLAPLHAEMRQVRIARLDSPLRDVAGTVTVRGELGQLDRWLATTDAQPPWRFAGAYDGRVELQSGAGGTRARLGLAVADMHAVAQNGGAWREPQVDLTAEASYHPASDTATISLVRLASNALGLEAQGRVERASASRELALQGRVDYDLAVVGPLLESRVDGLVLSGRESSSFSVAGSLSGDAPWAARLTGTADPAWQSMDVHGFAAGRGRLPLALSGGLLRIGPADIAIGGGRLHLDLRARLEPQPRELELGAGPLLEHVQITPEMCRAGLEYAVPALAGVTAAQGEFSVNLDGGRIPLDNASAGDAGGRLHVHSIEIGPGVLVRELEPLVQALAQVIKPSGRPLKPLGTARLRRESMVEFRLVDGRVYHRGLELEFPDLTLRTYGSVGLDRSLALMVEIPTDKWTGDDAPTQSLTGQAIRIPISGTLDHPKPDLSKLDDLMRQLPRRAMEAAEGVVREQLTRQLDRLLRPRSQDPPP